MASNKTDNQMTSFENTLIDDEKGMKALLLNIALYIEEEKLRLTDELFDQTLKKLNITLSEEHIEKHKDLLSILLTQVSKSFSQNQREKENMKIEYDINDFFYNDGTLLKDTIEIISTFRLSLMNQLKQNGILKELKSDDVVELYHNVIFIFDDVIRNTTKNFNSNNQKVFDAFEKEIMELAAPIVPIKKGVAILPLIGEFNENRAIFISNEVIPKVQKLNVDVLVIDFSGIHVLDTFVAHHFFQISNTLKLLGIQPVISGLRPLIAQTAVQLGIEMKDVKIFGTVQQCLEVLEKDETLLFN